MDLPDVAEKYPALKERFEKMGWADSGFGGQSFDLKELMWKAYKLRICRLRKLTPHCRLPQR